MDIDQGTANHPELKGIEAYLRRLRPAPLPRGSAARLQTALKYIAQDPARPDATPPVRK